MSGSLVSQTKYELLKLQENAAGFHSRSTRIRRIIFVPGIAALLTAISSVRNGRAAANHLRQHCSHASQDHYAVCRNAA